MLTPETLAELRRLLDAATPRPWIACEGEADVVIVLDDESNHWPGSYTAIASGFEQGGDYGLSDALLVTAAVNALPALLDAAAERDALAAKVERVRDLHSREVAWGNEDYSIDAEEYAARPRRSMLVGTSGPLAAFDVCAECYRVDGDVVLEGLWPCPTVRTLDGEARP